MSIETLTNIFDKSIEFLLSQIGQIYEFHVFGVTLTSGMERLYVYHHWKIPSTKGYKFTMRWIYIFQRWTAVHVRFEWYTPVYKRLRTSKLPKNIILPSDRTSASTFKISEVFRHSIVADSIGGKARTEDVVSVNIEVSANKRLAEGVADRFGSELDSSCSLQGAFLG